MIQVAGADHILWGTDSIWNGSPQSQIERLRRLKIADDLIEKHGYPQLTDEIKDQILGLNAARLFGIDPTAERKAIKTDKLSAVAGGAPLRPATRSNTQYGWVWVGDGRARRRPWGPESRGAGRLLREVASRLPGWIDPREGSKPSGAPADGAFRNRMTRAFTWLGYSGTGRPERRSAGSQVSRAARRGVAAGHQRADPAGGKTRVPRPIVGCGGGSGPALGHWSWRAGAATSAVRTVRALGRASAPEFGRRRTHRWYGPRPPP